MKSVHQIMNTQYTPTWFCNKMYEQKFLYALLLTISVELPVLIVLSKTFFSQQKWTTKKLLLAGITPTLTTLPYFWFVLPAFISSKLLYIITSESLAVGVETFIIYGLLNSSLLRSFVLSLLCNTASYLIGLVFIYFTQLFWITQRFCN